MIVEGEKCADVARSLGFTATTSAHGAKSARKTDWKPLQGRDVVILPDYDAAGEHYATEVARMVKHAGAKSIRVARIAENWRDIPVGGDVADALGVDGPWSTLSDYDVRSHIEALAARGAAFFVAERRDLGRKPGLEEALRARHPLMASCEAALLFDLRAKSGTSWP